MARRLKALSVFAVGVWAVAAAGQPPGNEKKADPKVVAPAPDTAIEAALATDPDVRLARAKIQLAEAELAKARQAVTQKVMTLRSLIVEQRKAVATAEESFALLAAVHAKGQASRGEVLVAREKLEAAQAALARSETELKLITSGPGAGAALGANVCSAAMNGTANCTACHVAVGGHPDAVALRIKAFAGVMAQAQAASGPIPERLRAALDTPVKIGEKNEKVTFEKALEAFKKVGLDVPVRVLVKVPSVSSLGEELPVGAWLQMFADETGDALLLVREYGLLVTGKSLGPPTDAVSVFDLWKQKPAAAKK